SDNLSVISGRTDKVVATVAVGGYPSALAYDEGRSEVFVASSATNQLSVVSDSTYAVTGSIAVGTDPEGMVYDSGFGEFLVSNAGQGTVSIIPLNEHRVTFSESGLLGGTLWGVSAGNGTYASTTTTIAFSEPNGTYSYSLGAVAGYFGSPSSSRSFRPQGLRMCRSGFLS